MPQPTYNADETQPQPRSLMGAGPGGDPPWLPEGYTHATFLGGGGEGEAWRARAFSGPSPVCIKRYRPGSGRSFYREVFALLEVRGSHIVRILDVIDGPGGERFLVMEYCSGGTLRQQLRSEGFFALSAGLQLGMQLSKALDCIHRKGIVHADLKPENIFRQRRIGEPTYKVADFGISARTHSADQATYAYTPAYAAPEQMRNQPCLASDIYSLAKVVLEACGADPARGPESTPTPLPAPVLQFMGRCLSIDPTVRPTAAEAVEFFARASAGSHVARYLSSTYNEILSQPQQAPPALGSGAGSDAS